MAQIGVKCPFCERTLPVKIDIFPAIGFMLMLLTGNGFAFSLSHQLAARHSPAFNESILRGDFRQ